MFPLFFDRINNTAYAVSENQLIANDKKVLLRNGIYYFADINSYASLFGDQWKEYKKTQLDSYSGQPITKERIKRIMGEELFNNLHNKVILEAGCGAGRFTEILLQQGAFVMSSDLSSAVEVNQENFPQNEKHKVIQADINDMPFENNVFDLVVCLGVIQHTANTEKTIKDLYDLVKPGGWLIIDHYTFSKSNYFRVAPLFRSYLKTKPASYTINYTKKLVNTFLPLHKKVAFVLPLRILLNRISPIISYYQVFPTFTEEQQKEWALLDTHDSLTDWNKRFRNKKQIVDSLLAMGAQNIWCEYGGNGVEARCKKG